MLCGKGGHRRTIPVTEVLQEILKEEFANRKWRPEDPLFLNLYGKRYMKMRTALKNACKQAKVPYTTHHGLRHAYASILRQQGRQIEVISKFLGHANPTVTQNIYVHWQDEQVRAAAEGIVIGKVQEKCKVGENAG